MKRDSDRKVRRRNKDTETSAIQIIEEAFHLLRSISGTSLWLYFFGTIPFACLFFYFWADMSRSSYGSRDAGLVSLGLALAFFWKCSWQARFCRDLWETISPGQAPVHTGWQAFRYHAALWFFQAWSIPITVLAICFVLPLGWALTFFENGSVLALTQDYGKKPFRQLLAQSLKNAHDKWAQNLAIWFTMGFIGLLSWANVYAACSLPPFLGKTFLGIDSVFSTISGALSNSTFVFGTLLVTYLILSPLMKSIFVLRCFYSTSRSTGLDLLSRLADLRKRRALSDRTRKTGSPATLRKVAGVLIFALGLIAPGMAQAQEKGAPVAVEIGRTSALDLAIQDTMAAKKYQWKFGRRTDLAIIENQEETWLQTQINLLANAIETKVRLFKTWLTEKIKDLIEKMNSSSRKRSPTSIPKINPTVGAALMQIGWGILIAIVAGLIIWLVAVLVKSFKGRETIESDSEVSTADIDLESEDIVADQLQEDQWMKLAREQIEKGEARLAIRALFLATLANLGERGLLKIQNYKSNRDYRNELDLKARHKTGLRAAFSENTGLFERVWYGLHQIGDESLSHFIKNYETISADSAVT